MATVSTPARQPFGILNESKLRGLQSIKNRQNAITPSSAPSLKRRAPSPELSDSENIDPYMFESNSKRKRAAVEDDVSLAKQPRIFTQVVPSTTQIHTPPTTTSHAPRLDTFSKPSSTPLSAPAAAGRSPTRARGRLIKPQPRRRFVPPTLGSPSPSLSIAAALKGTLAHKKISRTKKTSTLDEAKPKSWFFDIYEEPEAQQDYRMSEWTMTQSSAALEISDDEGKAKSFDGTVEKAEIGKENIDPNEMFVTSAPVTRAGVAAAALARAEEKKDSIKPEEPRTPLGDLNAAEFYGEGLDATSVVLVHDDVPQETSADFEATEGDAKIDVQEDQPSEPAVAPAIQDFTFEARHEPQADEQVEMPVQEIPEWAKKSSLALTSDALQGEPSEPGAESADIEIWESESAKDENEQHENQHPHHVIVGEGQTISLSGGCLQEL
ncbi:hypothetical protein PMZ80_006302 [Knufia obscura]|uniref:Uncharacterized protein n=2 Tax=Knufia TaxID=430999 RepID=A0AAN8I5U8_9EURO|nr:hypothetical protein PMZ80_006302 [Knufia obscura]KAK5953554.1 hypothetical protein OHC33_005498 [Knufia fluminis]